MRAIPGGKQLNLFEMKTFNSMKTFRIQRNVGYAPFFQGTGFNQDWKTSSNPRRLGMPDREFGLYSRFKWIAPEGVFLKRVGRTATVC